MHFEILVEGQTERTALEPLLTRILGPFGQPHTWRIHKHQGVGRLPADLGQRPSPRDRTLLHNLPSRLRAYGRSLGPDEVVVVLLDLDSADCRARKQALLAVLATCQPAPRALFRLAIEELEAWWLGDRAALLNAYPHANQESLAVYAQDSICGTWELLADALEPGGHRGLLRQGAHAPQQAKRRWARDIAPRVDPECNQSPSFQAFRTGVLRLARTAAN